MSIFYDKTDKRKNIFRTIIVVFFVVVLYACAFFCYNIFINKSIRNAPINYSETKDSYHFYYSPANKNKVALTFDDGPAIGVTRSIIETLKKNDVPATFFLLGQNVFLNPNLAKEISDSGFEIGNHSFTHAKNIHSSQNRLNLEVRSTNYLLEKITGKVPKYYRPPFLLGIGVNPTINPYTYTPNDMLWSLDNGLIPTGIDIDPKDWEYPSEKSVAENFEIAFNAFSIDLTNTSGRSTMPGPPP